jgi:hypothetical protein
VIDITELIHGRLARSSAESHREATSDGDGVALRVVIPTPAE